MTTPSPPPVAPKPTAPTRGQKLAGVALVAALVLWSIAAFAIASLISSLGGGSGGGTFVGYAMGAALVVVTPVMILTSQGLRAVGVAWAVFVGLVLLFFPLCGYILGG